MAAVTQCDRCGRTSPCAAKDGWTFMRVLVGEVPISHNKYFYYFDDGYKEHINLCPQCARLFRDGLFNKREEGCK